MPGFSWLVKLIAPNKQPRYRAPYNLQFHTDIKGVNYENQWIKIRESGWITVNALAPSDGCTPTFLILGLFYFGVPDGPVDQRTGMKVTAPAFFLHDHLLLIPEVVRIRFGINTKMIHRAFCKEIAKAPFWPKPIYCLLVKIMGPKDSLRKIADV